MGIPGRIWHVICPPRELRWPRAIALVALGIWALSLSYLLVAEPPWGESIAKQEARGLELKTEHFRILGHWWAAAANFLITSALLLTGKFWWGGRGQNPDTPVGIPPRRWAKLGWLLVASAVIYGGISRYPRLFHGLWNDEEYAYRRYVGGHYEAGENGAQNFRPVTWEKALCFNHSGNNHLLHTLFARASHLTWKRATGAADGEFSEAALRATPFLWGLAAIAVAGVVAWNIGGPPLAAAAAWMLALSPWHVRYSVEARGYSLMLLLLLLMVWMLGQARKKDGWGWWLGAALAGGMSVLSFAGCLYALVLPWAFALVSAARRKQLARPVVANAVALAVALPLFAPSIPQVLRYLGRDDTHRFVFGSEWLRDILSHFVVGVPPGPLVEGLQLGGDLHSLGPWAQAAVWWAFPLLLLAGALALLIKGAATGRAAVATFLLCMAPALVVASRSESPILSWYYLFALPSITLITPSAALFLHDKKKTYALTLLLCVAGYGILTHHPRRDLVLHERSGLRAAIGHIREESPSAITGAVGTASRQAHSYDPTLTLLSSADDLKALEGRAQAEGKPLYLYFCGGRGAPARNPDLVSAAEDPDRYRPAGKSLGFEEMFGYRIFVHQAGPD